MKITARIGTWNVKTLSEPSHLAQLCKEFKNYNLALFVVCESRWCDSEELITGNGLTFLCSGKPNDEPRASGVGFLVPREARRAIIDWKSYSD